MGSARRAGRAFFPLDEELGLLPGALTPSLQEDLVRLGVWMPFGRAAQELAHFRRTVVSRPTAERLTEAAGASYVALQTAEVAQLEREAPEAPAGPDKLFLSVDGAMVPLVGGEWAEVKTLVLGQVQPPVLENGEWVVHTSQHSYFSRLAEAETFQRLALVETHRRGVERAGAVAAVTDGAEWIQKFIDHHCYQATRILDFPHAGEHLNAIGQAQWGVASTEAQAWLGSQLHELKHTGPATVLAEARQLVARQAQPAEVVTHLTYLEKREAHMQYPAFRVAGWPIGDGAVESANKLVVEARLKGSGMHWARRHVNPMLALRNIVCSDRWDEAWPQIERTLRRQAQQRRAERHHHRRATHGSAPSQPAAALPGIPATQPALAAVTNTTSVPAPKPNTSPTQTQPGQSWRPPTDHPWRRMPIGRARFRPPIKHTGAKP